MKKESNKKLTCIVSDTDKEESRNIAHLKNIARFDNLDSDETCAIYDMISKKKQNLLRKSTKQRIQERKEIYSIICPMADGKAEIQISTQTAVKNLLKSSMNSFLSTLLRKFILNGWKCVSGMA